MPETGLLCLFLCDLFLIFFGGWVFLIRLYSLSDKCFYLCSITFNSVHTEVFDQSGDAHYWLRMVFPLWYLTLTIEFKWAGKLITYFAGKTTRAFRSETGFCLPASHVSVQFLVGSKYINWVLLSRFNRILARFPEGNSPQNSLKIVVRKHQVQFSIQLDNMRKSTYCIA